MVTFKAKIRDIGSSYVVTVPKQFVDQGLLMVGVEYSFELEEAKE